MDSRDRERLEIEVTVDRPREDVFRRFADDFAVTYPRFCSVVASVELGAGTRVATGVKGYMIVHNLFSKSRAELTVMAYEAPTFLAVELSWAGRTTVGEYRFREQGGATVIQAVSDVPVAGRGWLRRWNVAALRRHDRADARRLKPLLEADPDQQLPHSVYSSHLRRSIVIGVLGGAGLAVVWIVTHLSPA